MNKEKNVEKTIEDYLEAMLTGIYTFHRCCLSLGSDETECHIYDKTSERAWIYHNG